MGLLSRPDVVHDHNLVATGFPLEILFQREGLLRLQHNQDRYLIQEDRRGFLVMLVALLLILQNPCFPHEAVPFRVAPVIV